MSKLNKINNDSISSHDRSMSPVSHKKMGGGVAKDSSRLSLINLDSSMTNYAGEDPRLNSPMSGNLDDTMFSPTASRASQTSRKAKNHSMSHALLSSTGFGNVTGGLSNFALQQAKKEEQK